MPSNWLNSQPKKEKHLGMAVHCIYGHSCSHPTNTKPAFVQLAASFGIKFMETSAKANINIENVSTATFLLYLLSYKVCRSAVRAVAPLDWVRNSTADTSHGLLKSGGQIIIKQNS